MYIDPNMQVVQMQLAPRQREVNRREALQAQVL